MKNIGETEIEILRNIEKLLRDGREFLLKDIIHQACDCSNPTQKVFRSPEAFCISMCLDKLDNLKKE